jgi:hypothetical protein
MKGSKDKIYYAFLEFSSIEASFHEQEYLSTPKLIDENLIPFTKRGNRYLKM